MSSLAWFFCIIYAHLCSVICPLPISEYKPESFLTVELFRSRLGNELQRWRQQVGKHPRSVLSLLNLTQFLLLPLLSTVLYWFLSLINLHALGSQSVIDYLQFERTVFDCCAKNTEPYPAFLKKCFKNDIKILLFGWMNSPLVFSSTTPWKEIWKTEGTY